MKILMTTDAVGGVWQYSLDLATGLSQRGAGLLLATLGPRPSDAQRQQASSIPGITLTESDYPLEWMNNPWSGVDASGHWLRQLQANYCADLIHLNGYSHGVLAWNKPVVIVAHSCVFSWWRAVHGAVPGPQWAEYKTRVMQGLKAASAIVAPTVAMANNLATEYDVAVDKITSIANFSLVPRTVSPAKQPVIVAAGRIWDEAKNLKPLSALAPRLQWELRIADGTLTHANLCHEMTRASIFAHPSLYEPFGLSVLEAARSHCCLVLSDIPSLRELWDGAALFIDPRDTQEWVSQLNHLAGDEDHRNHLARLASARSEIYEVERSIQGYWKLYGELITNAQPKKTETAA